METAPREEALEPPGVGRNGGSFSGCEKSFGTSTDSFW